MGLDENYKRAVIKLANKEMPQVIRVLEEHTRAMKELTRAINNMPRSIRMHP